jgi:hypothetical protein
MTNKRALAQALMFGALYGRSKSLEAAEVEGTSSPPKFKLRSYQQKIADQLRNAPPVVYDTWGTPISVPTSLFKGNAESVQATLDAFKAHISKKAYAEADTLMVVDSLSELEGGGKTEVVRRMESARAGKSTVITRPSHRLNMERFLRSPPPVDVLPPKITLYYHVQYALMNWKSPSSR